MVDVTLDVEGLVLAFEDVDQQLDATLPMALDLGGDLVVAEAKATHDYVDRSGQLTASIQNNGVTGTWSAGTLEAHVAAGAPYAAAVEFGSRPHVIAAKPTRAKPHLRFPSSDGGFRFAKRVNHPGTREYRFLGNALASKEDEIAQAIQDAAALAMQRAGLR